MMNKAFHLRRLSGTIEAFDNDERTALMGRGESKGQGGLHGESRRRLYHPRLYALQKRFHRRTTVVVITLRK